MSDTIKTIDPFTNIEVIATEIDDQGAVFMSNLRTINVGDGGNNVFRSDRQGIWLGASKFVDEGVYAPFCVSMEGVLRATGAHISGTITASSIAIGTNGFHVDTSGNMWWGSSTTYAGATIKISSAGSINFTTGTFSGIIQTSRLGILRLQIDGDVLEFYDPSAVLSSAIMGTNIATDGVNGIAILLSPSARLTISSMTRSGTTVSVTTSTNHGASNGWWATIAGATQTDYNVSAEITVTGLTTFTFQTAETPSTPATGTLSVRVYPTSYLFSSAGFVMGGGMFEGDITINTGSDCSLFFGAGGMTPSAFITFGIDTDILEIQNSTGGLLTIGSAGQLTLDSYALGTGDIDIISGGDIWLHSHSATPSVLPAGNSGTITLGNSVKKWADVQSVLINGSDICLSNGWKLREYPASKEDLGKSNEWFKEHANKGIQILDDDERLIAVIHKDGYIYCKGTKSLEELI
jgi:hypothetical protein